MQELVKNASKDIARQYLEEREDPTETMIKVALDHELTAQQIQPIARRANRKILVKLQNQAAKEGGDARVTFPKIEPKHVVMVLRQRGELSDDTSPTAPDPSPDSSVLDQIFGTSSEEGCGETEGYTLEDYQKNPDAIPNEEMALRVLNKAKNDAEQAKRQMTQVENNLEEALHEIQKQAAQYLRAGEPIEPLKDLPGVEDEIDEVQEKVACDIHSIDGSYELQEDHPMVKLAERIQSLRKEYEEKKFDARVAQHRAKTFRDNIKGTYL
mgnify:CR=1 FL=1